MVKTILLFWHGGYHCRGSRWRSRLISPSPPKWFGERIALPRKDLPDLGLKGIENSLRAGDVQADQPDFSPTYFSSPWKPNRC